LNIRTDLLTGEANWLANFFSRSKSLAVLCGAGVSTASGIPDYRDRNGDAKHVQPIQFNEFVNSKRCRRQYWARSYIGWRRFSKARPNAAHAALADLESSGRLDTLITQNVDRLHHAAGNQRVIELHGDLSNVRCLDCGDVSARNDFQHDLEQRNPDWHAEIFRYNPDGDAELAERRCRSFSVPGCGVCDGIIKPDVVMFGEAVPKARVRHATAVIDRSDALLVVGSSLMVFSGFRFARQAAAQKKPIVIVNQGRTRADDLAAHKVEVDCSLVLSAAIKRLS
jgi:NAD-dependent SIR2 family protein deacetylase